jgi:hypothetical protein
MTNLITHEGQVETKPEWETPELVIGSVGSDTEGGLTFGNDGPSSGS